METIEQKAKELAKSKKEFWKIMTEEELEQLGYNKMSLIAEKYFKNTKYCDDDGKANPIYFPALNKIREEIKTNVIRLSIKRCKKEY